MRAARTMIPTLFAVLSIAACSKPAEQGAAPAADAAPAGGQASVQDNESEKNIVGIAVGSKDHTTLVAALKAADLVNALANAGPFTVFAPTNAAFDKLPKGTVEDLLKPEKKEELGLVLKHHVMTSSLGVDQLADGQVISMVDGTNVTIHKKGTDTFVNEAKVLASVKGSNGMVHVIDGVLVP